MSRLIFPEALEQQTHLLADVKAKYDASAPARTLLDPFFTEQEINITDDVAAIGTVLDLNKEFLRLLRKKEEFLESRNTKMKKAVENGKKILQNLKKFYVGKVQKLGDWGATVDGNRVKYPTDINTEGWHTLFTDIKTKHDSYAPPAISPLQAFLTEQNINLDTDIAALAQAIVSQHDHDHSNLQKEENREARDAAWKTPLANLTKTVNYIFKHFKGEERKCGEFGISVDSSTRAPKFRTSTIKLSSQITLGGIVIGSTLTNIGSVPVKVYKGSSARGSFTLVDPSGMLGIAKAMSILTIKNESDLQSAKVRTLRGGGS